MADDDVQEKGKACPEPSTEGTPEAGEALYHIPSSEVVVAALMEVMVRHKVVESQQELLRLVLVNLHREDPTFSLGEKRLRSIAFSTRKIKVMFRVREDKNHPRYTRCPVCDARLDKVHNATLKGGKIVVGARCTNCVYVSTAFRCSPRKYTFSYVDDDDDCPVDEPEGLMLWE